MPISSGNNKNNNNNSGSLPGTGSAGQQQPQRTIQVKIGNQAAKSMTPDQAADYLKSIAASSSGFFGNGGGVAGGGSFHREVKMTFENGSTSTVALPRISGMSGSSTKNSNVSTNAASVVGNSINNNISGSKVSLGGARSLASSNTTMSAGSTRADGMPCSEKEMKALMSMFVEIMGLQMNTERLNQVSPHGNSKLKSKSVPSKPSAVKDSSSGSKPSPSGAPNTNNTDNTTKPIGKVGIAAATMNTSSEKMKATASSLKGQAKKQTKKQPPQSKPSASCLKITTTQKIGPNEVITATMSTSIPTNKDNLFQFPTDLPPPPGGWPEDLLWPDKNQNHKIIIRNRGDDNNDLSDVDEDDDDDNEGNEGETVVVITTTALDDSDDDDNSDDDDDDSVYDEDADDFETDSEASSIDSLPALEAIPASERKAFRLLQQQNRIHAQNQQKILLTQQKRHEMFVMNGVHNDDDDDITIGDKEENLVVTGTAGIVPFEWGALERAAMEDALEQEERIRKETNKKRNESNNSKTGNRKGYRNSHSNSHNMHHHHMSSNNSIDSGSYADNSHANSNIHQSRSIDPDFIAFEKRVDALKKKLGKAVQSWRNRVVAAVQSNDDTKLKSLLKGTLPFNTSTGGAAEGTTTASATSSTSTGTSGISTKNASKTAGKAKKNASSNNSETDNNAAVPAEETMSEEDRLIQEEVLLPHLEVLVPHCVPKQIRQTSALQKGEGARELLTSFIMQQPGGLYFMVQPVLKAGASSNSIIFGRSALDTACFYGDTGVVRLIVPGLLKHFETDRKILLATADAGNIGGATSGIDSVVPIPPTPTESYRNFLHQTCQDSGWTPLHYAAISGSLLTVELLLRCEYSINYTTEATYKNKTYQLLPILYIESNDALTWRKHTVSSGKSSNNGSSNGRSGGITARQLVEFVKNGTTKKEIESHGMALEEIIDYYHLTNSINTSKPKIDENDTTVETQRYLAMLNLIHERLLDCEMNGYHTWDDDTVQQETAKALEHIKKTESVNTAIETDSGAGKKKKALSELSSPANPIEVKEVSSTNSDVESSLPASSADAPTVISSSASVATNNTNKQSGNNSKKKKNKKGQAQPITADKSSPLVAVTVPAVESAKDDPVVSALIGMGFARDQIMEGVKACGGIDRATADDVVAWIFGGNDGLNSQQQQSSPPSKKNSTAPVASQTNKVSGASKNQTPFETRGNPKESSVKKKQSLEEERLATEQKLAAKREEQRRRNREWNNRAQARQIQEDQEKLVKAAVEASSQQVVSGIAKQQSGPRVNVPGNVQQSAGLISGLPPLAPSVGLFGQNAATTPVVTANGPVSILRRASSTSTGGNPSDRGAKLPSVKRVVSASQSTSHYAAAAAGLVSAPPSNNSSYNFQGSPDLENIYSNDTSSIASSSDFRCPPLMRSNIIEVTDNNDDATVSTIGSTPAIIIQQLPSGGISAQNPLETVSSSYQAPPGFAEKNDLSAASKHTFMIPTSQPVAPSLATDNGPLGTSSRSRSSWDHDLSGQIGTSELKSTAPAFIPPSVLKQSAFYDHRSQPIAESSAQMSRSAAEMLYARAGAESSSLQVDAFGIESFVQSRHLPSFGDNPSFSENPALSVLSSNHQGLDAGLLTSAFGTSAHNDSAAVDLFLSSTSALDVTVTEASSAAVVPGLNIESFGNPNVGILESSIMDFASGSWGNNTSNRTSTGRSMLLGNVIGSGSRLDDPFGVSNNNSYDRLNPFVQSINVGSSHGNDVSGDTIGVSSLLQDHQGALAALGLVDDANEQGVDDSIDRWLVGDPDSISGVRHDPNSLTDPILGAPSPW